jgi:hypothetical protein
VNLNDAVTFWIGKGIASLIPLFIIIAIFAILFGVAAAIDGARWAARKTKQAASVGANMATTALMAAGPLPWIVSAMVLTAILTGLLLNGVKGVE